MRGAGVVVTGVEVRAADAEAFATAGIFWGVLFYNVPLSFVSRKGKDTLGSTELGRKRRIFYRLGTKSSTPLPSRSDLCKILVRDVGSTSRDRC